MQVCEKRQVGAQKRKLFCLWLLHLDHHLLTPCICGGRHDGCPSGHVFGVGDGRAFARIRLNEYLNPQPFKFPHTVRGEGYASF